MRRTLATVPLVTLVAFLVGCAPTPPPGATPSDPRPTPTTTSTPIPVPTPTVTLPAEEVEPLETVDRILLQTERASFCAGATCTVEGFGYDDDPAVVVAKLTAVFALEPVVDLYADDGNLAYTYRWGDGVALSFTEGPDLDLGVYLDITAASIAGVVVETEHAVRVGTSWADAAAVAESTDAFSGEAGTWSMAWFDTIELDDGFLVAVIASSDTGVRIDSIQAPATFGTYT
jgi:hypothetical protein